MNARRRIPYGVVNFEELVRECYFVDNTAYLRELEVVKTPVFLRPKRFGKSVWCSVLAHYYDVNLKDRFQELFGKTDIGKDPTPLANSFLVLRFNFSTIEVGSLAEIERNFFAHVRRSVELFTTHYAALADWSSVFEAENPASMIDAVRTVVLRCGLPPIYVIVDEYDNFTNELVVSNRDAETLAQAKRYRDSLPNRPDWNHPVETAVVEVYGNLGYRWFPVVDDCNCEKKRP